MTGVVYSILLSLLLSSALKIWRTHRKRLPLPPGPKGYPLIGNAYNKPQQYAWLEYAQWAKKYGNINSFTVFGSTTIVLNSLEDVVELLEKRSSNYSERERMVLANEMMGWDWDFGHMNYTDWWRRHRRMFHQYFQPRNMTAYHPIQTKMAHTFLEQLVHSPEKFSAHIRQYVGAVVLQAAYGYEVNTENDFYINLAHKAIYYYILAMPPGNFLVDFVPLLRYIPDWFPGAGFKRAAKDGAKRAGDLRDIPFDIVKKLMAEGSAPRCFVYDNMEKIKQDKTVNLIEEEEIVKNCAAVIYLGGSDTTSSLLSSWVLAMGRNPAVQKRGQYEVDRVLGMSRLPTFDDRSSMPYVEAILLETLRWFTITPFAVPHCTVTEDEYKGYRIPAGATITPNVWAILHDENLYPDPFEFRPERFLKDGYISFEQQPDPILTGAFGYGRRICAGRYLALNTAWLAVASILATLEISKAVDGKGRIIELPVEFTDGLISHPKSYQVQISPRFDGVRDLIEAAKAETVSFEPGQH